MLKLRDRDERGSVELGWLSSRHSFSFGHYHNPQHMGFRSLRVINEDRVVPGAGFPTHSHSDMEIISYVLEGALEHKDSLGTGAIIKPGEIQRMSAGTGIRHSEFNASQSDPVHFLQIWIEPDRGGGAPSYEQKTLPPLVNGENRLDLIGSPEGQEGAIKIHQDVRLYRVVLGQNGCLSVPISPGHYAWVQVARGTAEVDDRQLREGDGLSVSEASALKLTSSAGAELLVFDLA
jgi:redox-sensitive bicupin YhaK (pirin superfamily)